MRLAGKTALVTGGGTGIGEACALALAEEGCKVVVAGRREDKLRELASRFKGQPALLAHAVDVGDRESVNQLVKWSLAELGHIDILINSAGINVRKRLMADIEPADWDKVMQINATGAFNCIHAVLPKMRERRDGLIVNISSTSGKRAGLLGGVPYSASKFAMAALGTSVSIEEKDNGIRVTNLYPGEVETPILDQRPVPVSAEHRARILQPEDIGAVVLMLALLPPRANVPEIIVKPTTQLYA